MSSAVMSLSICFEIFGCARQYEQALFLDIFGCARHSPNKFGSALACTKIALSCTKIWCGNGVRKVKKPILLVEKIPFDMVAAFE